ncbi:DNA repair protein RecN [Desulfoscipio gibsoniae]|uniref:DNA repair protein RecN n=1 Tax=Desulfoscipio gibsoniae DSM 7213 TaxID=767817 RepID=R4KKB1_9FIRM|nr:DNA repair protein RecN [Desulfoscipio gibsoniae]AGL02002.1 DNA repair protein RecN [Desulfoscipio gibsoniae DSM 7213]
MLISLYIKHFGLIDEAEIEFIPGLNVLTGETGAGKSIVLEALQVVLGGRAQTELIRTGRDKALVQAVFDIAGLPGVRDRVTEAGMEMDEQEPDMLILSREINRLGRNPCRINGRIINLGIYRDIAGSLVDLHGQHEQQSLLMADRQMQLLDRYGGDQVLGLLQDTEQAYRQWRKNQRLMEKITSSGRERQQRIDMIKYQMEEIDAAQLAGVDENELTARRDVLANAERISLLVEQVLLSIHNSDNRCPAAVDLLGEANNNLDELCRYIPALKSTQENIFSALCLVEETARELASCKDNVEADPRELNYIEERLALLDRLKKKYGPGIADIMAYRQQISGEFDELLAMENDAAGIDELVHKSAMEYYALAQQLQAGRLKAAAGLEEAIERELKDLAMSSVQFAVQVSDAEPGPLGQNAVEFLISPNPGEPLRPLAKSASGGELSRVMLALKSILAAADEINILVFDEVDAGIGGYTLQAVADKLDRLSQTKQILCVTHAAAVAACAARHYLIKKSANSQRTVTSVTSLDGEDRINELSRMLGGGQESTALFHHVRDLLRCRVLKD